MIKNFVLCFFALSLAPVTVFCQTSYFEKDSNSFSFSYPMYAFDDGNGYILRSWRTSKTGGGRRMLSSAALGLKYSKHFENISLGINADFIGMNLNGKDVSEGAVFSRSAVMLSPEVTYNVLSSPTFCVNALGRLTYRYGVEKILASKSHFSWKTNYLNDVGIGLGLTGERAIFGSWFLSGEMSYTFFVYRMSRGQDAAFTGLTFDNGSTQHMFRTSLGIGWRF